MQCVRVKFTLVLEESGCSSFGIGLNEQHRASGSECAGKSCKYLCCVLLLEKKFHGWVTLHAL